MYIWSSECGKGKRFTVLKVTNEQYEKAKSCNVSVLNDLGNYKIIAIELKDYFRIRK